MASTDIVTTQIVVPDRDDSGGHRFFSKLARSPTGRKHKTTPSVNSAGSGLASEQLPNLRGSSYSYRRPQRPSIGRNITAPNGPVGLTVPTDTTLVRSHSDGENERTILVNGKMLDIGLSAAMLRPPPTASGKIIPQEGSQPIPLSGGIPNYQFQQIQDLAAKRIATLDYMRKAHENQKFWFNTVNFSKSDISKLPSYAPNRLSRRAMNYMLLGFSIPAVLDTHPQPHPNTTTAANTALALELLRSLNTLLNEFDTYQTLHPHDGSHVSSLSRARIPQMFKRAATTSRPRKSSGAPDIGQPSQISPPAMPDGAQNGSYLGSDSTYINGSFASSTPTLAYSSPAAAMSSGSIPMISSFPSPGPVDAPNSTLLPNEGPYIHLLTPSLPFTPDFYSVFSTLSDVLSDVYQRLLQVINSPATCTPAVGEAFVKADARIRKIMVGGIIRDFEGAARESAKRELLGVQKVVLGGLMGA